MELGSQKKPVGQPMSCFTRLLELPKETSRDWNQVGRTIQVTSCAKFGDQRKSEVTAKFVLEGEGGVNEGWTVFLGILTTSVQNLTPYCSTRF